MSINPHAQRQDDDVEITQCVFCGSWCEKNENQTINGKEYVCDDCWPVIETEERQRD